MGRIFAFKMAAGEDPTTLGDRPRGAAPSKCGAVLRWPCVGKGSVSGVRTRLRSCRRRPRGGVVINNMRLRLGPVESETLFTRKVVMIATFVAELQGVS